jgi:hypothetical protein
VPIDTINDVITALDAIVDRSLDEGSRFGYFAALYRRVTQRVKAGIAAGEFQDGPRMERLDVVFARRYFEPYNAFRAGLAVPRCWSVAFHACSDPLPCVLQHLAAGMNAHINFDLGVAAAEVAPGDALPALRDDFNQINAVLADETTGVEQALAGLSPALHLMRDAGMLTDHQIANFSLSKARELAWMTAERMASNPPDREQRLSLLDDTVAVLGAAVLHPPPAIALKLAAVRALEVNDVRRVTEALASETAGAFPDL